jgi:hypothetical protein
MRGSLAPDGAVLKRTVADDAPLSFRGPARVVHSREEGVAAAKAGRFVAGDVVVLTGLGLRGSPGMGLTSALMFAIDGAGLSTSVAVITDGQMSGLVNGGLVVAEVSPEGPRAGRSALSATVTWSPSTSTRGPLTSRSPPPNSTRAGRNCRHCARRPGAAGCRCTRGPSRRSARAQFSPGGTTPRTPRCADLLA